MYKHLIEEQRYLIYQCWQKKYSQAEIARLIGVSKSTVSRELKRNGNPKTGAYGHLTAQKKADARKARVANNRIDDYLRYRVKEMILDQQWSPKQIAGYLKEKEGIRISHETIYRMVRQDERLKKHMRHQLKYTRHKKPLKPTRATNIPNRVSIHERPKEADGKRFGDWEMDLIIGAGNKGAILTLTERSTNMILATKLQRGKQAKEVVKAVYRLLFPFKGEGVKTITTDNGSEFAAHQEITKKLGCPVYFADSYCSWQKGAIENANKLIRQYIPKKMCFDKVTEEYLKKVVAKINKRPRQKLNFRRPLECFFKFFL